MSAAYMAELNIILCNMIKVEAANLPMRSELQLLCFLMKPFVRFNRILTRSIYNFICCVFFTVINKQLTQEKIMKINRAKRAVTGACTALFANMGMNSVFAIFLSAFIAE